MFESNTEDVILQRLLDSVSDDLDKRAGSVLYTALSPCANEIARMYSDLDRFLQYTFASADMPDEFLDLRVGEMGVLRQSATRAIKKGTFKDSEGASIDIPLNSRFSIDNYNFIAIEKIITGEYKMQCEVEGTVGNYIEGLLIPIDYVENLSTATLEELLIPGENTEDNTSLYQRYLDRLNEKPFAGNISAYKEFTKGIEGVADVKVLPTWNGGGTVKLILIDTNYNSPSQELINKVQTAIDPIQNQGEGLGLAPVGHVVTVEGVKSLNVSIDVKVVLKNDVTVGQVQEEVTKVINNYFLDLKKTWADEEYLIIRTAQIDARILNIDGILDIETTKLNDKEENITLNINEIPVSNEVVISV